MAEALIGLFTMPWPELSGLQRMGLILPLTASVAVIYKTIKCPTVREIPLASLILWATIAIGMYVVGIVLTIIYQLLA